MNYFFKITATIFATIIFSWFWPKKIADGQARLDTSAPIKESNYVDSFFHAYDSTQMLLTEAKRTHRHKRKTSKRTPKTEKVTVYDTVYLNRIKHVPVSKTIDKKAYWELQRIYTDSIAQAKKDSIDWANRGFLKKLFGPKKQKR